MRLTPRRRAAIAVLVSWPLGWLYLYWAFFTSLDLLRYYRFSVTQDVCERSWESLLNDCDGTAYSPTLALSELVLGTLIAVAAAYGLARWVVHPLRTMAGTIRRFGPASLGLRLAAEGPRDETRQLADEVDAMLGRLAEGYEAQRRFAANASHELRTPLATQRALIEVSLQGALDPTQLELLARQLLATNERNERLVDGLLTLAETDRGLVSRGPVRLDEVVRDAVTMLESTAADVVVHCGIVPVTVDGERPLLERLAGNLVQNALKYNVPGGRLDVTVEPPGVLRVVNTGPIVPADQVAGLFEPFRRLSGERLDHGGGVGLGLTIVRSIVAAHGGEVAATANLDGGLAVEVRLVSDRRSGAPTVRAG